MFGYLSAELASLTEEELQRYRACYCGLCRSLGEEHGELSRLSLNYDMSFLVLLLSSLYEPEECAGESRCLPHPVHKRSWWINEATSYAAHMNIALTYHKCLDNAKDEHSLSARVLAAGLKSKYRSIEEKYPRQCAAIESSIGKLTALETENSSDADACATTFGELMAELLVWQEDRWADILRNMGMALGRFIYVMDACMDLERDMKKGSFNPFRHRAGEDNEEYFRDVLSLLLGECVYWFDMLPLVQDVQIMKNVLCTGLWAQFDKKYKKKESSDDPGSV